MSDENPPGEMTGEQLQQALEILIKFREEHGWSPDRYEPRELDTDDDESERPISEPR